VHHDDPEVALAKIDAILCSESQGNNTIAMAIATAAMSEMAGPSLLPLVMELSAGWKISKKKRISPMKSCCVVCNYGCHHQQKQVKWARQCQLVLPYHFQSSRELTKSMQRTRFIQILMMILPCLWRVIPAYLPSPIQLIKGGGKSGSCWAKKKAAMASSSNRHVKCSDAFQLYAHKASIQNKYTVLDQEKTHQQGHCC